MQPLDPKNIVTVSIIARMPVCQICGKQSDTMADHLRHETACERTAQEEVYQARLRSEGIRHSQQRVEELHALWTSEHCERCGRVHVFSSEDERCEREFSSHVIETLDTLQEIQDNKHLSKPL